MQALMVVLKPNSHSVQTHHLWKLIMEIEWDEADLYKKSAPCTERLSITPETGSIPTPEDIMSDSPMEDLEKKRQRSVMHALL